MSRKLTVEIDRLKDLFCYDPQSGELFWREGCNKVRAGQRAGKIGTQGYVIIRIDGRYYRGHRIIWALMTGAWPSGQIDHRDCRRSNNRWDNLRTATSFQQKCNTSRYRTNTSGVKGVYWDKPRAKWRARIGLGRRRIELGCFDNLDDAAAAYEQAAKEIFGEFARAS